MSSAEEDDPVVAGDEPIVIATGTTARELIGTNTSQYYCS